MPVISFVCHWYKWTLSECLRLNVRTFFSFHQEAMKMEARQYRERLDIAKVPTQSFEYYKYLRDRYNMMILPELRELPPPAPGPVVSFKNGEAHELLRGLMRNQRRAMGYV